ncbi:AP2-associated protein kinase 1-like [Canna indica]|uniref:AP2-associated protein kinase 1-like n=1 Tax=Canna indica TaxID=4628 RepID=A0AAQ3L3V8_9LILI|nr:AP2-associated protein kinase 1-like [Canna indica]
MCSPMVEEKRPVFDEEPSYQSKSKHNPRDNAREHRAKSPPRHSRKSPEVGSIQNQAFNMFVAEFDTSKLNSGNVVSGVSDKHRSTEEDLKAKLNRLK